MTSMKNVEESLKN
uniref:Uncharacterized protein n=1 Tax=Megaselia scalaris TaxID=36166 RepID=T1H3X9_MEGSC